MSKFEFTVKSYLSSLEEVIEHWFQKHFNHVTPGTPEHAVLVAAKEGLKADLGVPTPAPEPAPAPAEATSTPAAAPEPAPEPASTPAGEAEAAPAPSPAPETAA